MKHQSDEEKINKFFKILKEFYSFLPLHSQVFTGQYEQNIKLPSVIFLHDCLLQKMRTQIPLLPTQQNISTR